MSEINSATTSRHNLLVGAAGFAAGALSQTTPVARTVHAADRIKTQEATR
jgi:hypothetical protein